MALRKLHRKFIIPEKLNTPGNNYVKDLDYLLSQCKKNLRSFDEKLIIKAFRWCIEGHFNKERKSGEPYYTHPLGVAHIVIGEIPLDDISVASALLHELISEGDNYSIKDIRLEFGSIIAEIIDGITKIKHIEGHNIEHIENYRKLLLSLFTDVRIILIKLADRLHNMRTLSHLPPDRQIRVATETMEIYAPFAQRFGLGNIKWELEDIAFKYLNPEAYREISDAIQLTRNQREEYLKEFIKPLIKGFKEDWLFKDKKISFEIKGRAKHIYSIYNKRIARGKSINELFDLFAIRIILDTEDTNFCYITYGILSEIYKPVPGTFKNYITNMKNNGYQSIHTAVYGPGEKPVEVQIRTRNMNEVSERGVAAHFKYKRGLLPAQSVLEDKKFEEWMDTVRSIFENIGDETPDELFESVKMNLFQDEIYVFTPAHEFRALPRDSTPLDFAYYIHTDIGNHCIGAKVNGKIVPLNSKLQNGDQVEILTSKNQNPTPDFLKIAISQRARSYIIKYIKEDRKKWTAEGKRKWNLLIEKCRISISDVNLKNITWYFNFQSTDDMFYSLGKEELDSSQIELYLDTLENMKSGINPVQIQAGKGNGNGATVNYQSQINSLSRGFLDDRYSIKFADCCYPVPGDSISGIVQQGKSLIVHRSNCRKLVSLPAGNRSSIFEIDWQHLYERRLISKIKISGDEDSDLLQEITSLIKTLDNSQIRGFNFDSGDMGFNCWVTLEIKDLKHLHGIFDRLKSISGIKSVERFMQE